MSLLKSNNLLYSLFFQVIVFAHLMLRAQMTHLVQNVWKILSDTTPLQDVKNANAPLKEPSMPICLAISKVENASKCSRN